MWRGVRGVCIGSVVLATSVAASAHDGAAGVFKERMNGMETLKAAMTSGRDMLRGATVFDADALRQDAERIAAHSGKAMTRLFPVGSLDHPTEAKAEIWADWDRFTDSAAHPETPALLTEGGSPFTRACAIRGDRTAMITKTTGLALTDAASAIGCSLDLCAVALGR